MPTVAFVGNPNTGKTTLFNALTGLQQRTGNFPGVTVEKKVGRLRLGEREVELVDLPGTYSLAATSPDELVATDVLLGQQPGTDLPDAIVVIADAANIERNLYLITQVLECERPVVLALNMVDTADQKGLRIDTSKLGVLLGCQVVRTIANKARGLEELKTAISSALDEPGAQAGSQVKLGSAIEDAAQELTGFLRGFSSVLGRRAHRVEALRVLLDVGGETERRLIRALGPTLSAKLEELRQGVTDAGTELVIAEPEARYEYIDTVVRQVVKFDGQEDVHRSSASDRVDQFLTHPVGGTAVFLLLMAAVFQAIYTWSGPLMDFIDTSFGWFGEQVTALMPAGTLQSLVVDGVIAGVGGVVIFVPQIVILFGFIAILEDCGYMARAAFLMDRLMSWVGLSGRSFVPMLSSFACAVPGIMSARVIENRRDRFATILIAPLMSCSARLPVYTIMIAAFIPAKELFGGLLGLQALVLFSMYMLGMVVAVPVAWTLKRTLLKGDTPPFVMEMPGYKWPDIRTVVLRMLDRGKAFLLRAGTVILAMTVVVWALAYFPHPPEIADQYSTEEEIAGAYLRQSVLGQMGKFVEPAVRPLGWDWKIGMATLASFPAREVIIATLGTIYNLGGGEESQRLQEAMAAEAWPDGRPVFTPLVALSVMVFFALCCQCGATLAVMYRETGSWRWPLLAFTYMTTLAYLGALAVYQGGQLLGG